MASRPSVGTWKVGVDALVAGLGHIPDLLKHLHAEALVVGVVTCEVAVVLALRIGTGAAEDEFFPVAHCDFGRRKPGCCHIFSFG